MEEPSLLHRWQVVLWSLSSRPLRENEKKPHMASPQRHCPSQTHWRWGRGVFSGLGSTAGRTVASGMGIFCTGGLGATGGTKSPGLAASLGEASSVIFRNLGLLAGTGGGSDVGGPREDRWKDLSLSQFLEVAMAMAVELETELVP